MVDLNRYSKYIKWQEKEQASQSVITITLPRNAGHPTLESLQISVSDEMNNDKEFRVGDRLFKATRVRTMVSSMKSIVEIDLTL